MVDVAASGSGLEDVAGLRVGHYGRNEQGWLTGTTVVDCGPLGAVAGVDVRGAGPGTRETDALRPENLIQRVHAICLTGGSAYGLAAADGVMHELRRRRRGYPVGPRPDDVVPIVPTAVIFDLGRGGNARHTPTSRFGQLAITAPPTNAMYGSIGAGIGAVAGRIRGGLGQASITLDDGTVVAALAVTNSAGAAIDPGTALPWVADPDCPLRRPAAAERQAFVDHVTRPAPAQPANTVIGVIATDARLSKSECTKLAQIGHDGLARAVRPAHTMFDGDTIFGLATGSDPIVDDGAIPVYGDPSSRMAWFNRLLIAAAEMFALATVRGVLEAVGTAELPAYRDLCPSAFRARH